MRTYNTLWIAVTIFLGLTGITRAEEDDRVNLLSFNGQQPRGPVALMYGDEAFFIYFNPMSEDEIVLNTADVWVCADGDPGWPYPDNLHESFTMVVHKAIGTDLGERLYSVGVLYRETGFPTHWVTIRPNLRFTGPFFIGAIQANNFPLCEALMHDGNMDYPDRFWTNAGSRWRRCVDAGIDGFDGDIMALCNIDRTSEVRGKDGEFIVETIELSSAHPNPFNSSTNVQVKLAAPGAVSLQIFAVDGRLVDRLTYPQMPAGAFELPISLNGAPAGAYWARVESRGEVRTIPLIHTR